MLVRDYLDALRALPFASLDAIAGIGPILVVAPHQDDESLGCGGLIAAARARGQDVQVVFVTDGSGSHPSSALFPAARLVALRRDEAERALAVLGVDRGATAHLGFTDAAAPHDGPAFEAAVVELDQIVRERRIATVLVTSGLDPHCDHEAAAKMVAGLGRRHPHLRLLAYPIWSWHRNSDEVVSADLPSGWRLDIAAWLDQKRRAVACHASQMTDLIADDPAGFRFRPETLAPFLRPEETYIEMRP